MRLTGSQSRLNRNIMSFIVKVKKHIKTTFNLPSSLKSFCKYRTLMQCEQFLGNQGNCDWYGMFEITLFVDSFLDRGKYLCRMVCYLYTYRFWKHLVNWMTIETMLTGCWSIASSYSPLNLWLLQNSFLCTPTETMGWKNKTRREKTK